MYDTSNFEIRMFRCKIVRIINEQQLPIEVKSLVMNQIARDVAVEADKACLQEEIMQKEKERAGQQEQTGKPVVEEEVKTDGN